MNFASILLVIFLWISIWSVVDILVQKISIKLDKKDPQNIKFFVYIIMGIITVTLAQIYGINLG